MCLGCRIQGFSVEGFKLKILSLVLGAWARRLVGTVVSCGKQSRDSLGMEGIYKRCIWGMQGTGTKCPFSGQHSLTFRLCGWPVLSVFGLRTW